MRQIVLDTETTGLDPQQDHRIIEIGCVEMVDRRLTGNSYQQFLNPDREIEQGAIEVHGITNEQLADKPRFADIAQEFLEFIDGAELIIHNAPFDVGFIDYELNRAPLKLGKLEGRCSVTDTLPMAREKHPGQKNSLDALCKRYGVDNSQRDLHGALLDAQILADVYLAMTGGQESLLLGGEAEAGTGEVGAIRRLPEDRKRLRVIRASEEELREHEERLGAIDGVSGGGCLWRGLAPIDGV